MFVGYLLIGAIICYYIANSNEIDGCIQWIYIIAIGFIAIGAPIICIASLFIDAPATWWMWLITIAEVMFIIYMALNNLKPREK